MSAPQAMARRQIEYYVIRPSQSPDELFHQSVSTFHELFEVEQLHSRDPV